MLRGRKQFTIHTDRLRERLLARSCDGEAAHAIELVALRTLDCLDSVFREYFEGVEDQIHNPELGLPDYYIDGMILGIGLYLKFLPNLFPELTFDKIAEVFALSDLVDSKTLAPEEISPGNKPS